MSNTFLEELVRDNEPAPASTPAQDVKTETPVVADQAADRGDGRTAKGTFAPKAKSEGSETGVKEEPVAPAAQTAQPEPPAGEEGKSVPLAALNALKDKVKELERERDELRKPKPAEQSQQQPPQTPKSPDFSFEPPSFQENPQGNIDERLHQMKMQMSTNLALQQHGEQEVAEAYAALDQAATSDPRISAFTFSLRNHPHPMGEVVKWHKQQKEETQLRDAGGIDKLRESIRAQLLAEMNAQPQASATQPAPAATSVPMPKPATPETPPSLAKGGAGSRDAPETRPDNEAFENLFDKSKRQSRKR